MAYFLCIEDLQEIQCMVRGIQYDNCGHDYRLLSEEERNAGRGPDWYPVAGCTNCGATMIVPIRAKEAK